MTDKRIRIILDSKGAKRNADDLNDSVKDIGFSVNKLAAAISGVIAGGALANFLQESIAASIKFEKALSSLSAITGATGDDLNYLKQSSIELAKESTLSAAQVAEAFKLVASAKPDLLENAEALRQVTKEVIALAEAGEIELAQAANAVGQALNQFGEGADQAARFVNVLAAGAKFGASEISETAEAIKNSGVAAAAAGVSFEQANAAIQVLAGSGIKAAEAGTSLRNVLTILDTSTNQKLRPSVVGLSQALENLNKENLSAVDLVDLFGRENINAGRILSQNAKLLDELTASITGTNTAYEQQAIITDNLDGDIKRLNNSYDILKITVGELFTESLRSSVQTFAGAIDSAVKNFPQIIEAVEVLAFVFGARLGASVAAVTVAFISGQVQAVRYQAALASMAGVSRTAAIAQTALAVSARAASAAMALLGGPLGVIALAASALIYFSKQSSEAEADLDRLKSAGAGAAEEFKKFGEAQKTQSLELLREELRLATNQVEMYQKRLESNRKAGVNSWYSEEAKKANLALAADLERSQQRAAELQKTFNELNKIKMDETAEQLVWIKGHLADIADLNNLGLAKIGVGVKLPFSMIPRTQQKESERAAPKAEEIKAKGYDAYDELQDALDKENANLRVIESAKNVTKSLQEELALRRQIAEIYRSNELDADASFYEQQLAQIKIREAEDLAIAQARATEESAQREERLAATLENERLTQEARLALKAEFDAQEKTAAQILEEEKTRIAEEGKIAREELERAEWQARLDNFGALGDSLMALGQGQSKKIFKIGQTLALAQAAVSLPAAVLESFKNGGGYPWGLAPAAAMAATGLKNIQQIRSAGSGLGGGGGGSVPAPSLGGGAGGGQPSIPTTASTQPVEQRRVYEFRGASGGDSITMDQFKDFMEKDGAVVILSDALNDAKRRNVIGVTAR
jgi:TP901 family phage tail tape measure protein